MFNSRERRRRGRRAREHFEEDVITTCTSPALANPVHLLLEFLKFTFQRDRLAAQSRNGLPAASVAKATEK